MQPGGATSTVSAAAGPSMTSTAKPEVEGFSLEELKTMSTLGQSFRSMAVSLGPQKEHKFTSMALDAQIFFDAW